MRKGFNRTKLTKEKKFKKGKVNKAGDVVKPDTWLVVAKLSH